MTSVRTSSLRGPGSSPVSYSRFSEIKHTTGNKKFPDIGDNVLPYEFCEINKRTRAELGVSLGPRAILVFPALANLDFNLITFFGKCEVCDPNFVICTRI